MSESSSEDQLRAVAVGEMPPTYQRIVVADYDPAWASRFEEVAAVIRAAVGSAALAVDHVGSTSVPGLPAKPLLDINLLVPDPTDEAAYVPQLTAVGFELRIREPDWFEHRLLRGHEPDVNLHVFQQGCSEAERMIRFRDWLRNNPADRDLYASTKRELAQRDWKYVQDYANAKSAVVAEIMERALGSSTD